MIVYLSAEAEHDLKAIGDDIARDNPRRAVTFIQELRAGCMDLATLPESYPLVPRYQARGVRRRVHGADLIFYRAEPERVVVIHILNGAMDYERILFPG